MSLLGLDIGNKKTGLAISSGIVAAGFGELETVELKTKLPEIIQVNQVDRIIVGLPVNRDETQANKIKAITKSVLPANIAVEYVDETLSSVEGESHSGAAKIILQQYIDESTRIG